MNKWLARMNGWVVRQCLTAASAADYLEDRADVFCLIWQWNDALTYAVAWHNGSRYVIERFRA